MLRKKETRGLMQEPFIQSYLISSDISYCLTHSVTFNTHLNEFLIWKMFPPKHPSSKFVLSHGGRFGFAVYKLKRSQYIISQITKKTYSVLEKAGRIHLWSIPLGDFVMHVSVFNFLMDFW